MKLYDKYKMLKKVEVEKYYLFKSGNFYIFLDEDAKRIADVTTLKLSSFGNIMKCGFPLQSLEKYLLIFKNIGIDVVMVENKDDIVKELEKIDLDKLSKDRLITIVERFKNCI